MYNYWVINNSLLNWSLGINLINDFSPAISFYSLKTLHDEFKLYKAPYKSTNLKQSVLKHNSYNPGILDSVDTLIKPFSYDFFINEISFISNLRDNSSSYSNYEFILMIFSYLSLAMK